ncbi:hypothetical protein [Neorhizobium sp. AL 9.2.2]|uniref:hypothetical protein n=1 Tax=Neorhizobium sp. AL 9.2.2 TaxID=2712894 RepID=UPI0015725590|nr:hypothetical protein [Neorhizobium sp. AL 9.2.2]NSY16295.1 hypothetical protein [Neorhizobium sp. AL 9.2.2]
MSSGRNSEVASFIQEHIEESAYTVEEITLLLGFQSTEMVEGFCRGERKVPLDKVNALAEALGCDRRRLFLLVLSSWFDTDFVRMLEEVFANGSASSVEQGWIDFLRDFYSGNIPELTPQLQRRLRLLVSLPS